MTTEYCICVDGGTTNTRATLWSASKNRARNKRKNVIFERLAAAKREVGVRNTSIDGDNAALREAVRQCLAEVMRQAGVGWGQVSCIMAAGMITSNLGIYELPHLTAPVGLAAFARGVHRQDMPDIAPLPLHFIPGVRNLSLPVPEGQLAQMDIMRGEEVETLALFDRLPAGTACVLALPGSHTKFVFVDAQKRITACITTLGGEMLDLLTHQSILASTVDAQFAKEDNCDFAYLQQGFDAAGAYGLSRAAFNCRIRGLFSGASKPQMASFLLGAVLQQDVLALCRYVQGQQLASPCVFVAGKAALREPLAALLRGTGGFSRVEELPGREDLSARGSLAVALEKGLFGTVGA